MTTFILIHVVDDLLQICPEGWALWSGFCYLVGEGELSWGNAKAWCRDNNTYAKLVSIHSPMENDHVWQLLNELSGGRGWMGYSDASNPDHWTWEDGQNQFTYTRWGNILKSKSTYFSQLPLRQVGGERTERGPEGELRRVDGKRILERLAVR